MRWNIAITLCLICLSSVWNSPAIADPQHSMKPTVLKDPLYEDEKHGYSILPVLAANSTYGLMIGGAVIYYHPGEYLQKVSAVVLVNVSRQAYFLVDYERKGEVWSQGLRLLQSTFFDPYYGGDRRTIYTGPPAQIENDTFKLNPYLANNFHTEVNYEILWDFRRRQENKRVILPYGKIQRTQIFPNESTNVFGVAALYDKRHESQDWSYSQEGKYAKFVLQVMPGQWATSAVNQDPFFQGTADIRFYSKILPFFTFAQRYSGGFSAGEPTHAFQFSFGGAKDMRGYGLTRFFGTQFYEGQWEGRFPIFKALAGAAFVEAGDIGNHRFEGFLLDYGAGFRLALPPDYVGKARLDVGVSHETVNFSMEADHAF